MVSHRAGGASPLLQHGTRIAGRYVVVRELGEGGMGQVFEVEHEAIGRHFALKVLNISPCTDETLRRFKREARALGRVTTSRVAQVTDFGFEQGVGPFYVMELLDGETLEARLDREHYLPAHQAIPIAIDLCEALNEVHSVGIIHRDLKPSNAGLVRAGPVLVKLLDFGLAAATDAAVLERITRSQEVVGSLPYMAPERFHNAPLTHSIDLYALGVVLFEMFTGELPFQGASAAMLINQHLNEAPPQLSTIAPGLQIPATLEAIVSRLLDKDPEQRFQSAAAVGRALQLASIDIPMPTLADDSEDVSLASTLLAQSSEELSAVSSEAGTPAQSQDSINTIDASVTNAPATPKHTGVPASIPTSVIPDGASGAGLGIWPEPVKTPLTPTQPTPGASIGQPPKQGWVSGPVPPTTFEPSAAYAPNAASRQWIRIGAILAAGVIGSTLAAVLAFLILWDDGPPRQTPQPSTINNTRPQMPAQPLPPIPPVPLRSGVGINANRGSQQLRQTPTPPVTPGVVGKQLDAGTTTLALDATTDTSPPTKTSQPGKRQPPERHQPRERQDYRRGILDLPLIRGPSRPSRPSRPHSKGRWQGEIIDRP